MKSPFAFVAVILVIAHGLVLFHSSSRASNPTAQPETLDLHIYAAEGPAHFLVVEKKHQKLKLFEQGTVLRLVKEYTCATGENFGNKRNSGDSRTPEGIYFITEIYEDKKVTVFGSRAFHLDYPNIFDSHAGRLGDGIFIHGTNKKLTPNSTNGCITLDNRDLDELAPYLTVNSLPVIILDADSEANFGDSLGITKGSEKMKDLLATFSFENSAMPIDNIKTLSSLRLRDQAVISLTYKVLEDQATQYQERRRTYLTQGANGRWRTLHAIHNQEPAPTLLAQKPIKNDKVVKIAANTGNEGEPPEKSTPPLNLPPSQDLAAGGADSDVTQKPSPVIITKSKVPVRKTVEVVAAKAPRAPAGKAPVDNRTEEIFAFVEKWRASWAAKDIDTYMNCYSPSFRGGDLNKEQWREKKTFLNNKYKFISVKLSDIKVSLTASTAKVSFQQTYKSDQLQASGAKTLQLVNRKNRWFIESEGM